MTTRRRAVVLFLPPPIAGEIDVIRRQWDPVMTARIGAHLTLIRDVVDHDEATQAVAAAAAGTAPFRVRLTTTACWGSASYGVYVGIEDASGAVTTLHDRLSHVESPQWSGARFRPHVTLVHGRTVAAELAEPAWAALRDRSIDRAVELDAIDIIELDEPVGWHTVGRYSLAPAAIPDDAAGARRTLGAWWGRPRAPSLPGTATGTTSSN